MNDYHTMNMQNSSNVKNDPTYGELRDKKNYVDTYKWVYKIKSLLRNKPAAKF